MKRKYLLLLLSFGLLGCVDESTVPSDLSSLFSIDTSVVNSDSSSSVSTSSNNGGNSSSTNTGTLPQVDSKWNVNFNEFGQTFRNTLQACMGAKRRKHASYADNKTIGPAAAAYPNPNSSTFVPFYHTTDTVTTYASCNREHCWPQSRGAKEGTKPGNDPFMVRPTLTKDNSSRGNSSYGPAGVSGCWDPASLGFEGARGEAARIALYGATMYGGPLKDYDFGLQLTNNTGTANANMGVLKYMLAWNQAYPVTDIEKQINNYLDKNGYGRNPFVDHPEYAQFIWNDNGFQTSKVTGVDTNTSIDVDYVSTELTEPTYTIVNKLDDITKYSVAIVTKPSATETYYAMTKDTQSDQLPWYIVGSEVQLTSDKLGMKPVDEASVSKFTIAKQNDGSYTIYNEDNQCYLYNYTSGTHYSISYSTSVSNDSNISNKWKITQNGDGFTFVGASNTVYLEYFQSSYTGYKNNPNTPIYLYR